MAPNDDAEFAKALLVRDQKGIPPKPVENMAGVVAMAMARIPPEARADQYELAQAEKRQRDAIQRLHDQAPRYADCTLASFQIRYREQTPVVERLTRICKEIKQFVDGRNQLFLWGDVGTGKDHLAISVLRQAAIAGYSIVWREGLEIYEEIAQAFTEEKTHSEVYAKYFNPSILCISDPVFVENWKETKQEALRKVVHRRYNAGKATWVTVNFPTLDRADELFGTDVFDRLTEKAAMIHCDWESKRASIKSEY